MMRTCRSAPSPLGVSQRETPVFHSIISCQLSAISRQPRADRSLKADGWMLKAVGHDDWRSA